MPRTKIQRFQPITYPPDSTKPIWDGMIRKLSFPYKYPESEEDKFIRLERTSVLEQLIRKRWDSTFRANVQPPKNIRTFINLKADLWSRAIDLTQELHLSNGQLPHPAIWFTGIVEEMQLDCTSLRAVNETGEVIYTATKTSASKLAQHQNRQLKLLQNPFHPSFAYTHLLFSEALPIADRQNNFRKQRVTPLREAREKMVSYLLEDSCLLFRKENKGFFPSRQKRTTKFREHTQSFTG